MDATEDGKRAEDLVFTLAGGNSPEKNADHKQSRKSHVAFRASPKGKSGNIGAVSNRSSSHKVAFQEPLVSFNDTLDPLHGSVKGNLASTVSTIQGENASFIARDLKTNDFDLSRVSVRNAFKPSSKKNGNHSTPARPNIAEPTLNNDTPELPGISEQGKIIPLRVLNDPTQENFQKKQRSKVKNQGRDLKAAGVATVVSEFDTDQVYKYLQKEGIRNASKKSAPASSTAPRSPLFLSTPNAPYKRFDIVKQRKKMEKNSQALARLKEKIERQKQRSPSSTESPPSGSRSHREQDPVIATNLGVIGDIDKPLMRKIAQGPAAPKYKGFSTAETRIRTPDGKVWKDGENNPYIPPRAPQNDKRPKAVTALFKHDPKTKPSISSGRLKGASALQNSSRQMKSKNQKPVRKTGKLSLLHFFCTLYGGLYEGGFHLIIVTGKLRPDDPNHKKTLITPSSWREGQRIAESILGPPPKQAKKVGEKQRPNSPPTRDTSSASTKVPRPLPKPSDVGSSVSVSSAAFKPAVALSEKLELDGVSKSQKKSNSSLKATIPTDKLSAEARGVLDDLHLSSSESESDREEDKPFEPGRTRPSQHKKPQRGRSASPAKHPLPKDNKDSSKEKIPKTRHYDQNTVQEYIARQKAERKRKQSLERKAQREAQEKKQRQLEDLYRKQKEACGKKKGLEVEGKPRNLKIDAATAHALQRIEDILDEGSQEQADADSDKENYQRQQPVSRFDARMSAIMDKLNQYDTSARHSQPTVTTSKQTTIQPYVMKVPPKPPKEPDDKVGTDQPALSSNVASEFMQKLDKCLKEESPVTAVSELRPITPQGGADDFEHQEPNLTLEDLGRDGSPWRPETSPSYRDKYGDPSGTYSPRYRQMISTEVVSPREDTLRQKSRVDRIAALKAKAESLQDRIQAESRRLIDQPIVPIRPRLEEIDAILARSGHGGRLPIHAWTQDPVATDMGVQKSPRWLGSNKDSRAVDVPDAGRPGRGLDNLSPSQLPGVAGLRRHVNEVEENRKETDAARTIQSAFRGHIVRQAMDNWELPSGQSLTDMRRQATSLPKVQHDSDNEDPPTISEGPLSSQSDPPLSDRPPIKLRSVEEILEEMKQKEYCVDDPPVPQEGFKSSKWTETADDEESSRGHFLSDLGGRLRSGYSPRKDSDQLAGHQSEKAPWERTDGDKYSVINVFTNKYLKALKKQDKDRNTGDLDHVGGRRKPEIETLERQYSQKSPEVVSAEHSERLDSSSSRKSYNRSPSPRNDDTSQEISESLMSEGVDLVKSREQSPRSDASASRTSRADLIVEKYTGSKSLDKTTPSELLVGRVSYTSSEEEEPLRRDKSKLDSGGRAEERVYSMDRHPPQEVPTTAPFKSHTGTLAKTDPAEKKYSPAALEQRMAAELNYQEAIEESLRHLTGVERTQGVSLAQQETVSLAQLMKAKQLQHDLEVERMKMKAKEDVMELEKQRILAREEEDARQKKENEKMQVGSLG